MPVGMNCECWLVIHTTLSRHRSNGITSLITWFTHVKTMSELQIPQTHHLHFSFCDWVDSPQQESQNTMIPYIFNQHSCWTISLIYFSSTLLARWCLLGGTVTYLIFVGVITFNFCWCCYNEGKKRIEGEAGRTYTYQVGKWRLPG